MKIFWFGIFGLCLGLGVGLLREQPFQETVGLLIIGMAIGGFAGYIDECIS